MEHGEAAVGLTLYLPLLPLPKDLLANLLAFVIGKQVAAHLVNVTLQEGSNCDRCTVSEPTLSILLPHVYLEYGQDLLASENAVMTLYGLVARKDGSMLLTPVDAPDQGEKRMI